VPDATGLELIAQQLREQIDPDSILDTNFYRERATLIANPTHIKAIIKHLMDEGYGFLASLHGVDYYPEEPRLGVLYEMLDMDTVDRISVKARLHTEAPTIDSVLDLFPGANFPEREVFDMFGVNFEGHPDMRRILMPEDYEGHPQRRDFPVGGEPVLFTFNEEQSYGKWQ
jgi:NADH-quinone oxidoreductase subunit C